MMNLIFLGPPGAGKGTQSKIIAQKYNLAHIASGNILRTEILMGTELGKTAQGFIDLGLFVPDQVAIDMIFERLDNLEDGQGFLLDGFPRTLVQARELDKKMEESGKEISAVVDISVDSEVLLRRISNRRTCSECQASYNLESNPPKHLGVCDVCGGELQQRNDESVASMARRLKEYNKNTKPLIDYYHAQGLVQHVDGVQAIDDVTAAISKVAQDSVR